MLHLSLGLDIYIGIISFIFGACMGSFLNCMAWRIVNHESIMKGRSHCDICGATLGARDLIPILSYLMNHGKCRQCGAKLSIGHVVAEGFSGLTFLLLIFKYDISFQALEMLLFASILLGAAFADLKGYIIPDRFIAAGILFRIPFFFLLPDWKTNLIDALLGGFLIGGGLLLVVLLYEKIRQIEAMGGGDLKLLFVTGLYLGWAKNLLCLLIACVIGILFGLVTLKRRESSDSSSSEIAEDGESEENSNIFPWGPSISAAAIITLFVGQPLVDMYLGLF
jgi:leader peptidase (prepilin peptidase) / N-methyltransferase